MDVGRFVSNAPVPPGQVVGIVVGAVLHRLLPVGLPGTRVVRIAVGWTLAGAGCALNTWAMRARMRHTVGDFDLMQPQSLVTDGPYALSRHPMYVGWWFIHLGVGVSYGSAWVFATLPLAAVADHRAALEEEGMLSREFGDEFSEYARRVPRYLGWRSAAILVGRATAH